MIDTQSSNIMFIIIYIILFGIIGIAIIAGFIFLIYYLIKKLIKYYKTGE